MKIFSKQALFVLICLGMGFFTVSAQISRGGVSPGFIDRSRDYQIPSIIIPVPPSAKRSTDNIQRDAIPFEAGPILPVHKGLGQEPWTVIPGGKKQWRFMINIPGAKACAIYFENFYMPVGYELFIYDQDRNQLLGAFTDQNNHPSGLFAIGLVHGENIIVECVGPYIAIDHPRFTISDVLYVENLPSGHADNRIKSTLDAEACNVNVNCSEGEAWKNQRNGVVRILARVGASSFWCSGSVVNNTASDFKPYLLTADHCLRNSQGVYSTEANLNQWLFYFNYETGGCSNPTVKPTPGSMTGATLKANTGGGNANMGSDFCLLLLNQNIPASYEAFYNGWSRLNMPSPSGVSIHHPTGDIKKISTYNTLTISDAFNSSNQKDMYWRVRWAATANGHGVTEGGSSGSPLFNNEGLIVGQLTGGQSTCATPTSPDYYGKFSYSWESFSSEPYRQLKPWLDPISTGLTQLQGSFNTRQVVANFMADTTAIAVGSSVNFKDFSINNPDSWTWNFSGGLPGTSTDQHPASIKYDYLGEFEVLLKVTNAFSRDSLRRSKYIRVVPAIYPNPAREYLGLLLGSHKENRLDWELYYPTGQLLEAGTLAITGQYSSRIYFRSRYQGFFILRIAIGNLKPTFYRIALLK